MLWTLYRIVNLVNGKSYIGITSNFIRRMREHFRGRGSLLVRRAIDKYGLENLKWEVLNDADEATIRRQEVEFIQKLNTKTPFRYNLTDGGEGAVGPLYLKKHVRRCLKRGENLT